MKIAEKTNYTLISSEDNDFSKLLLTLEKEHLKYLKKHLIIKFSQDFCPSKQNVLLFLKYAQEHQSNGTSFVVVVKGVNIDDFPEMLNIVPTLVEAEDILDMENMQRELGF